MATGFLKKKKMHHPRRMRAGQRHMLLSYSLQVMEKLGMTVGYWKSENAPKVQSLFFECAIDH
jgi:hypothetical protein